MEELLPPLSCGTGWKIEGKPAFYDRDTLSDRINGEAELYFPYGFDRMAAARYASEKLPGAGMDVEIYRMGSLLDAFGMYANYRQKEGRTACRRRRVQSLRLPALPLPGALFRPSSSDRHR